MDKAAAFLDGQAEGLKAQAIKGWYRVNSPQAIEKHRCRKDTII